MPDTPEAEEIAAVLVEERLVDLPELAVDQPLVSSGLLDSIDLIRLIGKLEELYGARVGDNDLRAENFETCRSISGMLARGSAV
ncbi:MAG TPA: acyl carrier protein [Trebonia sp.]|jgi:acyl carrier protein